MSEAVAPMTMLANEDERRGRGLGRDLEGGLGDTGQGEVVVPGEETEADPATRDSSTHDRLGLVFIIIITFLGRLPQKILLLWLGVLQGNEDFPNWDIIIADNLRVTGVDRGVDQNVELVEERESEFSGSSIVCNVLAEHDLGVVTRMEPCEEGSTKKGEDHKELEHSLDALSLGKSRTIAALAPEPASATPLAATANGQLLLSLVDLVGGEQRLLLSYLCITRIRHNCGGV